MLKTKEFPQIVSSSVFAIEIAEALFNQFTVEHEKFLEAHKAYQTLAESDKLVFFEQQEADRLQTLYSGRRTMLLDLLEHLNSPYYSMAQEWMLTVSQ